MLLLLLCRQAQPPPAAWLSALLGHAEEQLEEMAPQHLAMMLIGLAKMQVRVMLHVRWDVVLPSLCTASHPRLGVCFGVGLMLGADYAGCAGCCFACSKLICMFCGLLCRLSHGVS
jgi:hypothetical protein